MGAVQHDQRELYLSTFSESDAKFDQKKSAGDQVSRLYSLDGYDGVKGFVSGSRTILFDSYSSRINLCGAWLKFGVFEDGSTKLLDTRFCKVPACPMCQWRRSMLWRAIFFSQMPVIANDYPGYSWVLLTLTVKNCKIHELRDTIKAINKGWQRLTQLADYPIVGCVKSIEVTRIWDWYDQDEQFLGRHGVTWWYRANDTYKKTKKGSDPKTWSAMPTDEVHPHVHSLGLVQPSYFGNKYVSQPRWVAMWQQSMRLDYSPVVHIQTIKSKLGETLLTVDQDGQVIDSKGMFAAICETLKYTIKEQDLIGSFCKDENTNSDWLKAFTEQLYLVRRVEYLGVLKEYGKEVAKVESDNSSLVSGNAKKEDNGKLISEKVFHWRKGIKRYLESSEVIVKDDSSIKL